MARARGAATAEPRLLLCLLSVGRTDRLPPGKGWLVTRSWRSRWDRDRKGPWAAQGLRV